MSIYPASIWLSQVWDELEKYNNQWVAALPGEVVVSGESLDEILEQIREDERHLEIMVFAYITQDINQ